MFRRIAITVAALAAAALLVASPRPASAGSASANLTVHATVLGVCTIAAAALEFGNYDPSVAGDLDAPASNITVRCTNGTAFHVDLGYGANPLATTTRRMAGGAAEFLRYELYSNPTHSTIWTTGAPQTASTAGAGLSDYTLPVYGRIFAGQAVSTGSYTDTVVMTVNF
jgi:spore coat protein U-like protein